jgi:hypothetical protein
MTVVRAWLGLAITAAVTVAAAGAGAIPPPPDRSDTQSPASKSDVVPAATPGPPTDQGRQGRSERAPAKPPGPPGGSNSLGDLKAPAGSVFVICDGLQEARELVPQGVVLSPQKYRDLLERIEQLERRAAPAKAETPTSCRLTGQVEGDHARFQAVFDFRTDRPRATVALGCQRGWPRPGAALDGHLPMLLWGDDGLLVQVEAAGVHQLTLDLEVPVLNRGTAATEQGVDLGLPRAAITTLDQFTVARAVTDVRVNGRSAATKPVDADLARLEGLPLGPAGRLELSWKAPASAPAKGPSLLEAVGRIGVRVDETRVTIDADLQLQAQGGAPKEWRIQLPPGVVPEVRVAADRLEGIDYPGPANPVLTVRLKEASADPLRVALQIRQPRPQTPVAVGPFVVLGAVRQRGTIWVNAPADFHVRYRLRGEVVQRDVGDESRREAPLAEFTYWNLPQPAQPGQAVPAPLEVEVEPIRGTVETRVEQNLLLRDGAWRVSTKISVTPVHIRLDQIEVQLPADYQYDPEVGVSPSDLVEGVDVREPRPGRRVAQIKLREQSQPFQVSLPGSYPVHRGATRLAMDLPRPVNTLDRGGQVTVAVPEGVELVATSPGPALAPGDRQATWRSDRAATHLDLAWRPHRTDVPAVGVADVTLAGPLARVRQTLRLHFSSGVPGQIALRVPPALAGQVRVLKGGTLGPDGVVTPADPGGNDVALTLAFSFPLPPPGTEPVRAGAPGGDGPTQASRRFTVPLVGATEATRAETKVRVWADPGSWPSLAQGPWEELPTEVVADEPRLPALVVRSGALDAPLALRLTELGEMMSAGVLIDHAFIQVTLAEDGDPTYRARFLVRHLSARHLDFEVPGSAAALHMEAFLDGKRLTRVRTVPTDGPPQGGAVTRLEIEPTLYHGPVVLDLRYQTPAGPARWPGGWRSTLEAPVPRAAVLLGRVRWEVLLPPGWVGLYREDGAFSERQWVWQAGLLQPRPAVTGAELQRWFRGDGTAPGALAEGEAPAEGLAPGALCWRHGFEPLSLVVVPRIGWLLACSLLVLAVGLALNLAPLPRGLRWAIAAGLVLGAASAGVWWPALLATGAYGAEPGILVLGLVLVAQWAVKRRHRRRITFLPSFTRVDSGSSIVPAANGQRAHGEPSTVDVIPKRGSSVK